jgi:hypothetical protein
MKRLTLTLLSLLCVASIANAIDHDNIDAGRPLLFDDATSIAYRERAFEIGVGLGFPERRSVGVGLSAEYLYGFARNTHLSIDFDPTIGGREGTTDRRADFGDVSVGLFRGLNRENLSTPATAVRADLSLPTGRGSRGPQVRLRGILSKTVRQYSRLHVNADANIFLQSDSGERAFQPALILGLTRPLGYPTRFDRTGLAEIAIRAGETNGSGAILSTGVGLRQQVTVRSVFDIGIQSDIAVVGRGTSRTPLRLVSGYSTQF